MTVRVGVRVRVRDRVRAEQRDRHEQQQDAREELRREDGDGLGLRLHDLHRVREGGDNGIDRLCARHASVGRQVWVRAGRVWRVAGRARRR